MCCSWMSRGGKFCTKDLKDEVDDIFCDDGWLQAWCVTQATTNHSFSHLVTFRGRLRKRCHVASSHWFAMTSLDCVVGKASTSLTCGPIKLQMTWSLSNETFAIVSMQSKCRCDVMVDQWDCVEHAFGRRFLGCFIFRRYDIYFLTPS